MKILDYQYEIPRVFQGVDYSKPHTLLAIVDLRKDLNTQPELFKNVILVAHRTGASVLIGMNHAQYSKAHLSIFYTSSVRIAEEIKLENTWPATLNVLADKFEKIFNFRLNDNITRQATVIYSEEPDKIESLIKEKFKLLPKVEKVSKEDRAFRKLEAKAQKAASENFSYRSIALARLSKSIDAEAIQKELDLCPPQCQKLVHDILKIVSNFPTDVNIIIEKLKNEK